MPSHDRKPRIVHFSNVKCILPVDSVISEILDYQQVGTKLWLNPDHIPDLGRELSYNNY